MNTEPDTHKKKTPTHICFRVTTKPGAATFHCIECDNQSEVDQVSYYAKEMGLRKIPYIEYRKAVATKCRRTFDEFIHDFVNAPTL